MRNVCILFTLKTFYSITFIYLFRQLVESKIFEILLGLSQDATLHADIKEAVKDSLEKAKAWELIKKAPKEG